MYIQGDANQIGTLFISLQDVYTSFERIITFAVHEYGGVGFFRIKMKLLFSSEVMASRKVSNFQLFRFDFITLHCIEMSQRHFFHASFTILRIEKRSN